MGPNARNLHTLDLFAAEAQRVHELLDELDVPRIEVMGPLTMAQRMELYVRSQRDTRDTLRRIQ